jgi:hypothetical protein
VARRKCGHHCGLALELAGSVSHPAFADCSQKLVRRTAPESAKELKSVLHGAWRFIPQAGIDKLCEAFKTRLEFYRAKGEGSISNDLWEISERTDTENANQGQLLDIVFESTSAGQTGQILLQS